MKNAIIVPGRPDKTEFYDASLPANSEAHWYSWLKRQLIVRDILTVSIEMPLPFQPRYEAWKKEFERFDITPDTILVGHSCGGGFLIRYMSEHSEQQFGKVVLVAPWINPQHKPASDTADFFNFTINPDIAQRAQSVTVFVSSDDSSDVVETVQQLTAQVSNFDLKEYDDKGHFTIESLKTVEFPELLTVII